MPNTRDFKSLGVIASSATPITDRQGNRVQGTAYRNTDVTLENQQEGLVYDSVAISENMNQKLFNQSSFTDVIDSRGILGWSDDVDYVAPAIVSASNGKLYIARDSSGNGTRIGQPIDPASTSFDISTWWVEFESATPLREELADETAGEEGSRLVGYNKSNSNGGIDEGVTVKDSLDELYKNTPIQPFTLLAYGYLDILQQDRGTGFAHSQVIMNDFNIRENDPVEPLGGGATTIGPPGTRIYFQNPVPTPYSIMVNFSERASNSVGFRGYSYSFDNLTSDYFEVYPRVRGDDRDSGTRFWQTVYFGPNRAMYNTFSFLIYTLRET